MGGSKPSTPERDLLKLIEEDNGQGSIPSRGKRKLRGIFSLSAARGRFSFLRSSISMILHPREFNIASLNKLLGIIFLFLFFYAAIDITLSMASLNGELAAAFKIAKKRSFHSQREVSYLKELKYYLNEAKKRNIFSIVTVEKKKELKKEDNVQEIAEKTSHLKLVGIAWGDNPDAMIEDTRAKRTIFVKEGDSINDIMVKKIFKEKVILSLEGKDIELK